MCEQTTDWWDPIDAYIRSHAQATPSIIGALQGIKPVGILNKTVIVAAANSFLYNTVTQYMRSVFEEAIHSVLGADYNFDVYEETSSVSEEKSQVIQKNTSPFLETPTPITKSSSLPDLDTPSNASEDSSSKNDALKDLLDSPKKSSPQSPSSIKLEKEKNSDFSAALSDDIKDESRLNPKYTFDTFVIGKSNRFSHAAAVAVAENPAISYNPLFIYGGSGLGKTHLLHAIGHYSREICPSLRVIYVNSEEFTNDFINSIRDDRAESFQNRYRSVDVLIIDDIQFLTGKEQTLEEFFHTFNTLHSTGKQIVITSDVPPKDLNGFAERLRSRFESGITTDVVPPDLETRTAILRKKAVSEKLNIPNEVLSYIASHITSNIRELEGALIRVTAFASLNRQEPSMSLAEMVLKDLIVDADENQITPALIVGQTAEYYKYSIEQLCSTDRSAGVSNARQVAMYLCREITELSLPRIGQFFGGRDHSTVLYSNRKISEKIRENSILFTQIQELTNRIKHASSRQKSSLEDE